MDCKEYLAKMRSIQNSILEFIEEEEDNVEEKYENLIKLLTNLKISENLYEFKTFLYLVAKISNDHYRTKDFFKKINQILMYFKIKIKQTFSKSEIFDIFKNNKKILLTLHEEKIMEIDQSIATKIISKKYQKAKYPEYFFNEIKLYIDSSLSRKISKIEFPNDYDEKRKIGENENDFCEIIRKDSIEQFIIFVNKNNFPLNTKIQTSIYETNPYFFKKEPTLIEYAAFFGSVQIVTYLYKNDVVLNPTLLPYAIHGNNPELIQIFESNNISFNNKCLKESIKCHHIDMANYIQNNFSDEKTDINNYDNNIISYAFHYYNFYYFPENFDGKFIFHYACQYDYYTIVDHFLKTKCININETIVLYIFVFAYEI